MEDALKMTSGIGCGNALNEMTAKGIDEEYTHSGKGASVGRSAMEGSFETRERDTEICFRKAIEITPNFAAAYSNLGGILIELGKLEEAENFERNERKSHLGF